jgi:hypothetical protein
VKLQAHLLPLSCYLSQICILVKIQTKSFACIYVIHEDARSVLHTLQKVGTNLFYCKFALHFENAGLLGLPGSDQENIPSNFARMVGANVKKTSGGCF